MMFTMFSPARTCRSQTVGCEVRSCGLVIGHPSPLAELDDVRVLRPERRTFGDVSTWAWDTHDELVGLLCLSCGDVSDGHGDETCDNDICGHCGSEDTQRVITDADDHVLRGA